MVLTPLALWDQEVIGALDKRGFKVIWGGNSSEPYKGFRLFCAGVLSEDKSNRVVVCSPKLAWHVSVKAVRVFVGGG